MCNDNCKVAVSDYWSDNLYTWCTNCGNYGIAAATKRALSKLEIAPKDALLCFDIGCNGNGADKIDGYRFHGLHGRVLPFATGAQLANRKMTVIASGGDGATFSEGINHLVHAIRCNYNITFLLHNNSNYGLTQGQASSLTRPEVPMSASPDGTTADTIHAAHFALNLGCGFVARTFSGDVGHMTQTIKEGIKHEGFSFIEILQNCPTYNKVTPHEWYMQRVYKLGEDHATNNLEEALKTSRDLEEKIALGIIFRDENNLSFDKRQANRQNITSELVDEVYARDVSALVERFK